MSGSSLPLYGLTALAVHARGVAVVSRLFWRRCFERPTGKSRGWFVLVAVLAIGVLGGCASKPPADIKLKSELMAAADVNPNRRGTPQPVKVHVFYLKQDDAFQIANFSALVDPANGAIASELVRREERLLGPGDSIRLDSKFDPDTRFIGVVAEFTRIENADWRALVAVPKGSLKDKLNPFSGKKLMVALAGTSVRAEVAKD